MSDLTIRDLRNRGGDVIDRVLSGETVVITTVNPADFPDIDGLTVRSVPHPDAAHTA